MNKWISSVVVVLALQLGGTAFAAKNKKADLFAVDADHSGIQFKVSHLIGKVSGNFNTFEGKVDLDGKKIDKIKIWGKIEAASINTGNQKRDEHLRSPDFFDVNNPKHPEYQTITFESEKFTDVVNKGEEVVGKLHGKITIHGVTKPIVLDTVIRGLDKDGKAMIDPWGNERVAVTAVGNVNRKDFGLDWNKPLEKAGGLLVGDEVDITLEVEAYRKGSAEMEQNKKVSKKEDNSSK